MPTLNFKTANIPVSDEPRSFDPLPAGRYQAMIIASEMRNTIAGNGQYLLLTFEILGPTHSKRRIWDRLNIVNPNPKAEQIAQRQLANLCAALGRDGVQESEELHNMPLNLEIGLQENKKMERMENLIKGYLPINQTPAVVTATAKTSASATPPWKR